MHRANPGVDFPTIRATGLPLWTALLRIRIYADSESLPWSKSRHRYRSPMARLSPGHMADPAASVKQPLAPKASHLFPLWASDYLHSRYRALETTACPSLAG